MDYDGDQGMGGGMHFNHNDIFSTFFGGGMGGMGGMGGFSSGRSSKGGQSFTFRFG
jgi:hypothetical protein